MREIKTNDVAADDGYLILIKLLEGKGYRKEALDRKLLATRRHDTLTRRPYQFFALENMACADAVKEGATVDKDRRAYHMLTKSGMTDEHINRVYAFVNDLAEASLDPQKVQSAVLRFYDKPWDVHGHRDARVALERYIRLVLGGGQHGGRPCDKGKGSSMYVYEKWVQANESEQDLAWAQEQCLTPTEEVWAQEDTGDDYAEEEGDMETFWTGAVVAKRLGCGGGRELL